MGTIHANISPKLQRDIYLFLYIATANPHSDWVHFKKHITTLIVTILHPKNRIKTHPNIKEYYIYNGMIIDILENEKYFPKI